MITQRWDNKKNGRQEILFPAYKISFIVCTRRKFYIQHEELLHMEIIRIMPQ